MSVVWHTSQVSVIRQECLNFSWEKLLEQDSVCIYIYFFNPIHIISLKHNFYGKTITRMNKFMLNTMQPLKTDLKRVKWNDVFDSLKGLRLPTTHQSLGAWNGFSFTFLGRTNPMDNLILDFQTPELKENEFL